MRIRPGVTIAFVCLLALGSLTWWRLAVRERSNAGEQAAKSLSTMTVPWPHAGQAALTVEDMGPVGTSGVDGPVPIASLAKVMTAYLVLKQHPLDKDGRGFSVTMGEREVVDFEQRRDDDQSVVAVQVGEVLDERQLLEALLLPSGNNIAIVLAEHEAGSVSAFVDRMNAAADKLGMHNTTYTDPSGLDPGTVSTAPDQVKVVQAALRDRTFTSIVGETSATLPVAGRVKNTNPLLGDAGVIGVKTGSDDAAGGCLAFAVVRSVGGHDVRVVGVVLGQRGGGTRAAPGAPGVALEAGGGTDAGESGEGSGLLEAAAHAARPLVEAVYSGLSRAA